MHGIEPGNTCAVINLCTVEFILRNMKLYLRAQSFLATLKYFPEDKDRFLAQMCK